MEEAVALARLRALKEQGREAEARRRAERGEAVRIGANPIGSYAEDNPEAHAQNATSTSS